MTHAELVKRAERWLRNTKRCGVVVTEEYSMARSIPDAMGWKSYASYLIECKVTRGDFLSDRKKHHRANVELDMGDYRYYMTPPGLLSPDELPKHWGLLEAEAHRVRVIKESFGASRYRTALNERPLLYKLLRQAVQGDPS